MQQFNIFIRKSNINFIFTFITNSLILTFLQSGLKTCAADKLYNDGCTEALEAFADEFGIVVIIIVAVVILFQLLCLIAACYSKKKELIVA